jgi:glycosyltransferase involved in cell wall biosynthesis
MAVLIPCFNEEAAIGKVVADFRRALPDAAIYVYDNNSSDRTIEVASAAGAIVRREELQGKGNVVRRMFADIDADLYVLVDGDDTYDASHAPELVEKLIDGRFDMINGARLSKTKEAYRRGHRLGNVILTKMMSWTFGHRIKDMLSGYRVFSRRFVKSFPALASGFEIETELTVHALELRMRVAEVLVPYKERPPGSVSKLHTFWDGFRILKTIIVLIKEERPIQFFSALAAAMILAAALLATPLIATYLETGLVPRFPTAVLATGLVVLASLSLVCGLILDTVTRGRQEMKRMGYLSIPLARSEDALERMRP